MTSLTGEQKRLAGLVKEEASVGLHPPQVDRWGLSEQDRGVTRRIGHVQIGRKTGKTNSVIYGGTAFTLATFLWLCKDNSVICSCDFPAVKRHLLGWNNFLLGFSYCCSTWTLVSQFTQAPPNINLSRGVISQLKAQNMTGPLISVIKL